MSTHEAPARSWRVAWFGRQLDIVAIMVVHLLPKRVRWWAVELHRGPQWIQARRRLEQHDAVES